MKASYRVIRVLICQNVPVSKLKLEPLERLDLRKCTTVGEIVLAMSKCSFGARMLGEVAHKISAWIQEGKRVRVVYDGTALLDTFKRMKERGVGDLSLDEFIRLRDRGERE